MSEQQPTDSLQERLPVNLVLEKQEREFGNGVILEGTIGGHRVLVTGNKNKDKFRGKVNGIELNPEQAQAIFEKYKGVAVKDPRLLEEEREPEMLTAALAEIL